jgi:hypothetical protein
MTPVMAPGAQASGRALARIALKAHFTPSPGACPQQRRPRRLEEVPFVLLSRVPWGGGAGHRRIGCLSSGLWPQALRLVALGHRSLGTQDLKPQPMENIGRKYAPLQVLAGVPPQGTLGCYVLASPAPSPRDALAPGGASASVSVLLSVGFLPVLCSEPTRLADDLIGRFFLQTPR